MGVVRVTLEFESMQEMLDHLGQINTEQVVEIDSVAETKAPARNVKKTGGKRAAKKKAENQAEKPQTSGEVTLETCRDKLKNVAASVSMSASVDIIKSFDINRIGELEPYQFSDFIAKCDAALAGAA